MITEFRGAYRFLSNFYPSNGSTVEHLYQSAKTTSEDEAKWIMSAPTPGEAKRRGRKIRYFRRDWSSVKLSIMEGLVRDKFRDPKLASMLLGTGDEILQEGNTWGDTYWGVYCGRGENYLGKILMKIRDGLRTRSSSKVDDL